MDFWNTLWPILCAILMLCVFIVVHEAGHFWMGRLFGFKIDEFAIGFGHAIFSRKAKSGTVFSLRILPLGGFCKFRSEDEEGDDPESFNKQKAWKRFLVLLAGPAMNFLLAYLLAFVMLFGFGDFLLGIAEVNANSPAAVAGIEAGDLILKVDGKDAYSYKLSKQLAKAHPDGVELTIERGENEINVFVPNIYNESEGKNLLGVMIGRSDQRRNFSFGDAFLQTGDYMFTLSTDMLKSLASIFTNPAQLSQSVTGPVGTIQIMGEGIRSGMESALMLAVIISLNLGVFNLLPIPALDGARIVFTLIEMVFRKPVPRSIEGWIHFAGFAALIILMIVVTFSDISRLAGG